MNIPVGCDISYHNISHVCIFDLQIGIHGIRIEFLNNGHRKTATYLPEVSKEQGKQIRPYREALPFGWHLCVFVCVCICVCTHGCGCACVCLCICMLCVVRVCVSVYLYVVCSV